MRTVFRILAAASMIASPFLSGCISGFDRTAAEARLDSIPVGKTGRIEAALKTPFKVAVFADMETMDPPGNFEETWDWNGGDRHLITSYLDNLKDLGYISEYFIIPDRTNLQMHDMKQLMEEAGKQNADVLLTVRGVIQVNSYLNPSAILNLTIIGGWLFPCSNRDVMMMVRVNLWNVKDGDCMLAVNDEGVKKVSEPTFLVDTRKTVDGVKRDVLRKGLANFKKKCRGIETGKQQ